MNSADDGSSPTPSNSVSPKLSPKASVAGEQGKVAGTVVRFTTGSTVVTVAITEDTATARDFVSMLPMTLAFEDFHGQEKVATPPRPFDYTGAPGMTPQVGDLFSYKPWGNLGFFYNVDGLGHSDDLVRLGTTTDLDAVMDLEGRRVTIDGAE